jgi:fimbrial isopeptide formation D2 family protein/LPXTG-motif cell wall-anchored protein
MSALHHRGLRTAVAVAAGLVLTGLAAVPALAAGETVDPSRQGSLTIHKYEEPDAATGLPNDGTQVDPGLLAGLDPIAGVEFSIRQVPGIDLTTNAGWQAAADLTVPAATAAASGVPPITRTTDAAGVAGFAGLPLGLYLVEETLYPSGAVPAAPFLVTLPLTHPTDLSSWLYDVHVYPKNVVTGATKTVEDLDDIQLGDEVTWTITGDIPNGGRTDAYRVVDVLAPQLGYAAARVSLTDGTVVSEGTHYTVGHDVATNTVTLAFTEAGLDLLAAHADARVQVEIDTVVTAIGEISNEAQVFPNQSAVDTGDPVVTPPSVTKYGNATFRKVDQAGASLAGATFQVYETLADAEAGTHPLTIGGVDRWTSDARGLLTISGLRYSNFANGVEVTDPAQWTHYYLVEVQAPAGFELLAAPIRFDVTSGDTAVDVTIENVPSNAGFQLPLTGATGTGLIVVAGGLLLSGALLLTVRSRRERVAEAA